MKINTLIAALFVFAFTGSLSAQKLDAKKVPLAVRSELMRRYPDAGKATWEKRGANYRANWGGKVNKDNSAMFTPGSAFIGLSNPTDPKFLPIAIKSYIQLHYHSPIVGADKSLNTVGKVFYEVKTQNGKYITFTGEGRFVKAE